MSAKSAAVPKGIGGALFIGRIGEAIIPYAGADDDKLPDYIKELSEDKRAQWSAIWNSAYESCIDDGGKAGDCEGSAFAQANGVVLGEERMSEELSANERGFLAAMRGLMKQWFGPPGSTPPAQERALSMGRIHEQLWTMLDEMDREMGSWNWLIDIYADAGELFAIVTRDGLLYRVGLGIEGDRLSMDGEWTRVTETFTPVSDVPRTIVRRQADGRFRWFSVSASSVLNRVAEIDSRELFDSFVAHAEETGEYPERWFIHLGEKFRTGQADWLARDGNLYLSSGLYDDTPLAQIEVKARQNNPDGWGDSIGYWATEDAEMVRIAQDVAVPVYRAGINKEISTLPEAEAANLFTTGFVQEVHREMALNSKAMEALVALHRDAGSADPEQDALALLDTLGVEERNRSIEADGLITRGTAADDDDDGEVIEIEGLVDAVTEEQELELDDEAVRMIGRSILDSTEFGEMLKPMFESAEQTRALVDAVEALRTHSVERGKKIDRLLSKLEGRLAALERDETERQSEWLEDLPAANRLKVTYRPRDAHRGTGANHGDEDLGDDPLSSTAIREKTLSGPNIPKY